MQYSCFTIIIINCLYLTITKYRAETRNWKQNSNLSLCQDPEYLRQTSRVDSNSNSVAMSTFNCLLLRFSLRFMVGNSKTFPGINFCVVTRHKNRFKLQFPSFRHIWCLCQAVGLVLLFFSAGLHRIRHYGLLSLQIFYYVIPFSGAYWNASMLTLTPCHSHMLPPNTTPYSYSYLISSPPPPPTTLMCGNLVLYYSSRRTSHTDRL